jgi:hypothetical protein
MDYGEVLRRSWQITWKYKGLWVLGILSSCSGGGGGGGGGANGQASGFRGYQTGGQEFPQLQHFFNSIAPQTWILIGIVVLLLVLVIGLIFLVLGVIGDGGLIGAFNVADSGGQTGLGQAFRMGTTYFWKLLGVRILFWIIGLVVGLVVAVAVILVTIGTFGIGLLCLLPLLCLLIPAGLVVGVYVMLTQIALVIENLGVLDAFRRAWEVLKANLGPIIVMGLIVVIGSWLVGLLLAVPLIAIVLPVGFALALGTKTAANSGLIFAGLCLVVYVPVLIVLNGILRTYITGVWTLTYRRLTQRLGVVPGEAPAPPVVAS